MLVIKAMADKTNKRIRVGKFQKKVILLLALGLSLGFAYTSGQRRRVWRSFSKEWEKIDQAYLYDAIQSLYQNKMVDYRERANGVVDIVLNEEGKRKALSYKIEEMKIEKPICWDKKWRLVAFDIPKNLKKTREALRFHLKRLGLRQLQKSLFVFPYDCKNEIDFIIEIYSIRPFVRHIIADQIDNELHLKKQFDLL